MTTSSRDMTNRLSGTPTPSDRPFRRRLLMAGLGVLAVGATRPAWSQQLSLGQARNERLVGEQRDGLLGIVQNSAGVSALVQRVNGERMAEYRRIAESTGAPLSAVQQRAGAQLIQRAQASGWPVQAAGGGWQ